MAGEASVVPRTDFPILERVAYLNTASFGLPALPVQQVARDFDDQIWTSGTVGFDDEAEAAVYEGSREAVGRLLNCDPFGVALTGSATEAIAQLAWGLDLPRGSNVVSTNIEFPSVTYPWLRAAEDNGTEVRLVDVIDDPTALTVGRVAELVDDRTSVLCISHVQYGTGGRLDPAALAELAHAHGATFILDTYQSAGVVPLDVAAFDADAVVGGGMKWLCGTAGAAFCYVRPELVERLRPAVIGWRSPADPPNFDARSIRLAPGARRMEFATMAYSAGLALQRAIDYVLDAGVERILRHSLDLGDRLIAGVEELGGTTQTPREEDARAGVVNIRFPDRDSADLTDALNAADIIVSPRLGGTRVSLHMFNDASDVDRALDVLEHVTRSPG
jgi:selenocysteine lyase/cysteine desulfurase